MKYPKTFVLYNCKIIQVERNCKIIDGSVYVKDGVIEQVGVVDAPMDILYLDMGGKYLLPGLTNLHVHLFGSGKPSKILGGGKLQQLVLKFIRTGLGKVVLDKIVANSAKTQLMSGCTTIRTVGDFHYSDVRIRNKAAKGKIAAPRMIVSGPAITAVGGHGDGTFALTATDPEELRALVRQNVANGVDFIKICITGGVIDATKRGEPGELKMTQQQAFAVCDEAHKLGKIVASHTESEGGIQVAVACGVDTIEHGADFTLQDVADVKANGKAVVATFSPAVPLAHLPANVTKLTELATYNTQVLLDEMTCGAKLCLSQGVTLGMGTDSSCPFVTQYAMPNEVWFFAKYLGVSNACALTTATLTNAQIAGVGDIAGSIEVGKRADFIAMADNPLFDLDALNRLSLVCANGIIYDNPRFKRKKSVDKHLNQIKMDLSSPV